MYNTIYNLNAKTTTDFASLLVVSACLGLIHSLEHRSRRYREVAGTSSNQSSLPCSQEYDGVLTGSCVCWHRLPSANGLAFRYRPPGRTASYRLMGRSPTARIDHLPLRVAVPSAGCGLRHTVRWAIFAGDGEIGHLQHPSDRGSEGISNVRKTECSRRLNSI